MNDIRRYVQIPIVSCVGKKDFLIHEIVEFLKQKYEVTVDAQMISIKEIIVPKGAQNSTSTGTEPELPIENTELDAGDLMAERAAETEIENKAIAEDKATELSEEASKQADADMEEQKMLDEEKAKAQAEDDAKAQEEMEQEQAEQEEAASIKWGEE